MLGGNAPEDAAVGVDEMPANAIGGVLCAGHERRHFPKTLSPEKTRCEGVEARARLTFGPAQPGRA